MVVRIIRSVFGEMQLGRISPLASSRSPGARGSASARLKVDALVDNACRNRGGSGNPPLNWSCDLVARPAWGERPRRAAPSLLVGPSSSGAKARRKPGARVAPGRRVLGESLLCACRSMPSSGWQERPASRAARYARYESRLVAAVRASRSPSLLDKASSAHCGADTPPNVAFPRRVLQRAFHPGQDAAANSWNDAFGREALSRG
mmetsp:Transcript_10646/g.31140  ORF Transcript_10646/g.31140 Transcript_10646/m.31140 type:complete len:205 (-) Transcript_10646:305-919(-)